MNYRLLKISSANLLIVSLFIFPSLALAQGGGSTGGSGVVKSGITYDCATKTAVDSKGNTVLDPKTGSPIQISGECGFEDLVDATVYAVNYASAIAIGFISIVIAFAGFKYMTSEGNPGKRAQANGVLTKAVIGIFFIVAAWLIVQFIVRALGVNTGAITF